MDSSLAGKHLVVECPDRIDVRRRAYIGPGDVEFLGARMEPDSDASSVQIKQRRRRVASDWTARTIVAVLFVAAAALVAERIFGYHLSILILIGR